MESESEKEALTAGGAGDVGMMLPAKKGTQEKSGVEDRPGGEAAGGGNTCESTAADADAARMGGLHGVENREK